LLGVADVKATKQFYISRGLAVGKSFGSKYVEFDTPGSPVKLALYGRPAPPRTPAWSRTASCGTPPPAECRIR
jgi:hypothetical protein